MDNAIQKAFNRGINGCIEHNLAINEMIKNARIKRNTLHITCFDLADSFGSVIHQLIFHQIRRNPILLQIETYVKTFYPNLESRVVTKE